MGSVNASLVDKWLEPDNLLLLQCWARDGYTRKQIADNMGINNATLSKWARDYEPIGNALKNGNEIIDYKVENALLKSALGYTTKEIKVTLGRKVVNGEMVDLVKEVTEKEIAPNVTACAMWLNNRKPDKWKRNRDNSIEVEDQDNDIQITIVRGAKGDKEEDNINREIRLEKKSKNIPKTDSNGKRPISIKGEDRVIDRDYWPDDWEDADNG